MTSVQVVGALSGRRPRAHDRGRRATFARLTLWSHVTPSTRSPVSANGSVTTFAVLLIALLAGALIGLLAINTAIAQDAFRLDELRQDQRQTTERLEAAQRAVESLRAPQSLAARAAGLGMIPAGNPAFLSTPGGVAEGSSRRGDSAATKPSRMPRELEDGPSR